MAIPRFGSFSLKVSAIVPYSRSSVTKTLKSLLDQSFPLYEIILVRDPSTDFVPEGFRVITGRRGDVGYNRELGTRLARGSLILWADDDAIFPRDWLERAINLYLKSGKAVSGVAKDGILMNLRAKVSPLSEAALLFPKSLFLELGGCKASDGFYDWVFIDKLTRRGMITYSEDLCFKHPTTSTIRNLLFSGIGIGLLTIAVIARRHEVRTP